MPQPNRYDEIVYPTETYRQTHPDRLATAGVLMGMKPPPPDHCRVLELGCGTGTNLLFMALAFPQSEFVGLDYAAIPLAQARSVAEERGLRNVRFVHRDLLDDLTDLGHFDYVIAHGLYSWTPAAVRERVLAVSAQSLTEQGIAFVSFTVYPGAYHRRMIREMLLYHAPETHPVAVQLERADDLLTFLAESMPNPEMYREILRQEKSLFEQLGKGHYANDNLSSDNVPVYFHNFMEHASRHRLQFLGDSSASRLMRGLYPPAVLYKLDELASSSTNLSPRLAREQYRDFLDGRLFRESLLCRQEVPLAEEPSPEHVQALFVSSAARPVAAHPGEPAGTLSFQLSTGEPIRIDHPIAIAALTILSECSPAGVSFQELLSRTQAKVAARTCEPLELAEILLMAESAGLVEFNVNQPRCASAVSERPVGSPVARWQISRGKPVTNLWHFPVKMDEPLVRHLFTLLDGSRDRTALADGLATFMEQRQMFPRRNDMIISEPAALRRLLAENMDANLQRFVRLSLLVS
jgi:methyltransferase-like protein/SAM-dependent methyltransferase